MSLGINREIKTGRLTEDPKVIDIGNDKQMVVFTIAVNEKRGEKESVEFVECAAFNGLVGVIDQYFEKGKYITVFGRQNTRKNEKEDKTYYNRNLEVQKIAFPGSGFAYTFIQGRTTSSGQLKWRDTKNGKLAVFRLTVAVNEVWKDRETGEKKENVNFYSCEFTGKYGEALSKKMEKGSPVMVEGAEDFNSVKREDGDGYDNYRKLRGWDLIWVPMDNDKEVATPEGSVSKESENAEDMALDENLENEDLKVDLDSDDFGEIDIDDSDLDEFDGLEL